MNDTNHGQMQPSLYRLSQLAIEAAEHAEAEGNEDEAQQHYIKAAHLQERWASISTWKDRPITRSTFTRSAASLYFRAGALDDALRLARVLTTTEGVLPGEVTKGHEIIAMVAQAREADAKP
jgi:hypothetical protein